MRHEITVDLTEKNCFTILPEKHCRDGIAAIVPSFLSCNGWFFFVFLLVLVLATPPGHARRGNPPRFFIVVLVLATQPRHARRGNTPRFLRWSEKTVVSLWCPSWVTRHYYHFSPHTVIKLVMASASAPQYWVMSWWFRCGVRRGRSVFDFSQWLWALVSMFRWP